MDIKFAVLFNQAKKHNIPEGVWFFDSAFLRGSSSSLSIFAFSLFDSVKVKTTRRGARGGRARGRGRR